MRLKQLTLQNIGPFIEAEMDVTDAGEQPALVVLITGENGTGKSIILDAIRGMFGPNYAQLADPKPIINRQTEIINLISRGEECARRVIRLADREGRPPGKQAIEEYTDG